MSANHMQKIGKVMGYSCGKPGHRLISLSLDQFVFEEILTRQVAPDREMVSGKNAGCCCDFDQPPTSIGTYQPALPAILSLPYELLPRHFEIRSGFDGFANTASNELVA